MYHQNCISQMILYPMALLQAFSIDTIVLVFFSIFYSLLPTL